MRIYKGGNCVSDLPKPPLASRQQDWSSYITGVKAMYKRIFQIRNGKPVILRTSNWYAAAIAQPPSSPFYRPISWKQAGLVDACTKEFEMFAWAISNAAAAYRVRVADVYTPFNGKDHRQDPVAKARAT